MANLPRLKAQAKIERGDFAGLDYRGVYHLYLTAFGDPELALAAQTAFLENQIKRDTNAALG